MLEDLGAECPQHIKVPPHHMESCPNVMTPEVPTNFESLDKYLEFRINYVFIHEGRHSGLRERMAALPPLIPTGTSRAKPTVSTTSSEARTSRPC